MPTNPFFRKTDYVYEQRLMQDLTDEHIQINGLDVFYLPRTLVAEDPLLTQDALSRFDQAFRIEMFLKTWEGFQGDGDLMSKFGLSVADRMTMSVSKRRFQETVGSKVGIVRPREGDLVFFPLTKGLFEIKFAEHEGVFYQAGTLTFYDLTLEKFQYDSETIDTGVPFIDEIMGIHALSSDNFRILDENGNWITDEASSEIMDEHYAMASSDPVAQNQEFETQGNTIIDWTETNPFGDT
jgi:Virus neck protein